MPFDCLAFLAAIDHALALLHEGADLLDIGGESTRPGARTKDEGVSAGEELRRIITVIEGVLIAGLAVDAHAGYIYVRGEMMYVIHILERAIQEAYNNGFLGKNILGTGYSLDLYVQPG